MKNYVFFFILISICFCVSCEDFLEKKYRVTVINHSAANISFYVSGINHVYPDTAIENNRIAMQDLPPGRFGVWDISYPLEEYFDELPQDTLSFFIFSTDTLNTYDWPVIRDEYKILKRYDLSLQDLINSNEKVIYP